MQPVRPPRCRFVLFSCWTNFNRFNTRPSEEPNFLLRLRGSRVRTLIEAFKYTAQPGPPGQTGWSVGSKEPLGGSVTTLTPPGDLRWGGGPHHHAGFSENRVEGG